MEKLWKELNSLIIKSNKNWIMLICHQKKCILNKIKIILIRKILVMIQNPNPKTQLRKRKKKENNWKMLVHRLQNNQRKMELELVMKVENFPQFVWENGIFLLHHFYHISIFTKCFQEWYRYFSVPFFKFQI